MQGKYIVIEGHEGTGKTSQVGRICQRLKQTGREVVELTEPGSAPIAQELRTIIKNATLERDALTNLLLFTAARRETWRQTTKPALERGAWVVAGRNWYSTLAIQGYAESVDIATIEEVTRQFTEERYIHPDSVFILSMHNEAERQTRLEKRGLPAVADTFESRDAQFQDSIHKGYEIIAKERKAVVIEADQSLEAITDAIWQHLCQQFKIS